MRRKYWPRSNITVRSRSYEPRLPFELTTLGLVLEVMGYKTVLEESDKRASDASRLFGCASCRGIEVAKSCVLAYNDAIGNPASVFSGPAIGVLNGVNARLGAVAAQPFGTSAEALYRNGLRDAGGQPFNLLGTGAYNELKTNKKYIGNGIGNAVKKASAHAHSVISRHSLEVGMRFGLCEYIGAIAFSGTTIRFRHVRHIARRALAMVDPNAQVEETLRSEIAWLAASCKKWDRESAWLIDWDLGLTLLDRLIGRLAAVTRSSERTKRATCSALTSIYRAVILHYARKKVRKTKTWSGLEAFNPFLEKIAAYRPLSAFGASDSAEVRIGNFSAELKGKGATLLTLIDDNGRSWKTQGEVELGKQCGECEVQQGSFDLVGRAVEAYVALGGNAANPIAGAAFSELAVDTTDGDTIWDLGNAITLTAVDLVLRDVHKRAAGTDARSRVAAEVMGALDESGPLFLIYMEVLFLGIGYEGGNMMAKVLEERGVDRSDLDGTVALLDGNGGLDRAPGPRGPTVVELSDAAKKQAESVRAAMQESGGNITVAAKKLGISFNELRDEETPLDRIRQQYRTLALEQHPDRTGGGSDAFKETAAAVALLRQYFGLSVEAPRGPQLMITER